jgi:hypothetical protein
VGFLSAYSGTQKIDLGGGYWIEVRECLSIVDKQRAEKALASSPKVDMSGNGTVSLDTVAFHNAMLEASIVAWNLDDDNGTVWALAPSNVKRDNIARLPAPVFDQVWQVVNDLNGPRERADQVRFPEPGVVGDQVGDGGSAEPADVRAGAAVVAAPWAAPVGSGDAPVA